MFIVKKEVFEWIKTGQKTIELRKAKPRLETRQSFYVEETLEEKSLAKTKGT